MTTDEIAAKAAKHTAKKLKLGKIDQSILQADIKSAIEKALLHQKPGESTDLAYEVGRRSPATASGQEKWWFEHAVMRKETK